MNPTTEFVPTVHTPPLSRPARLTRAYRVLLVDLSRGIGGIETRVLLLVQALQKRVAHCSVAVLEGSLLHRRLEAAGLPTTVLRGHLRDPRLLLQLWYAIRQGEYDIVDAHNVPSILWSHLASALARVPGCVTTVHSFYRKEYPGLKGRLYEGILALDRMVARQYINVTEGLQQIAVARGDAPRSTLIHNVVPAPAQIRDGKDLRLIAQWGFDPDDYIVAIIARLVPVKGHIYLFRALRQLTDLPQLKLLVVGDGPLDQNLKKEASRLGIAERLFFTGFRDDVARILPCVDCVCLASLSEGLPIVALEAATHARPLVATAVGGLPTLFADPATARLVPPRDPDALAAGLRWVVEHPVEARQMGRAARHLIRRSFSLDRMVAQTLEVYDRAAV